MIHCDIQLFANNAKDLIRIFRLANKYLNREINHLFDSHRRLCYKVNRIVNKYDGLARVCVLLDDDEVINKRKGSKFRIESDSEINQKHERQRLNDLLPSHLVTRLHLMSSQNWSMTLSSSGSNVNIVLARHIDPNEQRGDECIAIADTELTRTYNKFMMQLFLNMKHSFHEIAYISG